MTRTIALTSPRPRYQQTARRPGWAELPAAVRAVIEARVGGMAEPAPSAGGGFTPGFAARVAGRGGRWFVKAASIVEVPFVAESYLAEARINPLLPEAVPAPRLRWVEQVEDWAVVGFDLVEGHMPRQPWRSDELAAALDAHAAAAEALDPAPEAFAALGLGTLAEQDGEFGFWRGLAGRATGADRLPGYVPHAWIEPLARLEADWSTATAGSCVLHHDLRADNILIEPTGTAVICDWNWAVLGPAWLDLTVLLATAFADGHDASALLARHPSASGADPEQIDVALAGLAGLFVDRGGQPEVPTSPALRGHQRFSAEVVLRWLAERRGWAM
ncbi:MAG TPA: phosphotransferase [Actinospica sp.]|jgi:aminoglycoside phosphotransferase (APT) family kinase protein|nr:phosphotransferase [Actinospica sp.]